MPEHEMPEYDEFATTYQHWSATASPYSVIETYTFFRVLGALRGLRVLDLACGEGRTSRMLMEHGAASVLGGDISTEMVHRAIEENSTGYSVEDGTPMRTWQNLRYMVLDARDSAFQLDPPADLVTAMYLFHYAPSEDDLARMAKLIARNLKPGGRFVTYTLNPDYDFHKHEPHLMECCGFDYAYESGNHCDLIIGDRYVDIWQWSRADHESCLRSAGLDGIRWHPLQSSPNRPDVADTMGFYLANPSCIVLSASKPG